MPVHCAIIFPPVSEDQMRTIDHDVMKLAFSVQSELGRLADEVVYKHALASRLRRSGIECVVEPSIEVEFRSFRKTYYMDLVVLNSVPYELKVASALNSGHESQLPMYLYLVNASRGKLINFRPTSVQWRFVNATLSCAERHRFGVADSRWQGSGRFRNLVIEMVQDLGTCLSHSLYSEALLANVGEERK